LADIQKGLKYEYMLYKQIEKNNVLSYSNKTQFYVDGNWINISDGNIDLHEVERFIGTMVDQLNKFGFFVSNVGYSEKAINRVRNSSVKNIILYPSIYDEITIDNLEKDSNLPITKDGTINVA
ncbi:10707_t:CDS:2, partial [Entrophospora sp. SA101]